MGFFKGFFGKNDSASLTWDKGNDFGIYDYVCERCGKEFDRQDACNAFDATLGMIRYDSNCINKAFCYTCMEEAVGDPDPGDYTGICSSCGCSFDLSEAINSFMSRTDGDMNYIDTWDHGSLCADCAVTSYDGIKKYDPFG